MIDELHDNRPQGEEWASLSSINGSSLAISDAVCIYPWERPPLYVSSYCCKSSTRLYDDHHIGGWMYGEDPIILTPHSKWFVRGSPFLVNVVSDTSDRS